MVEERYALTINATESKKLQNFLEKLRTVKFVKVVVAEKTFDIVFDKNIRE